MNDDANREVAEVTQADDFVVSTKLISLLLTQLSEDRRLGEVFAALFSPEGLGDPPEAGRRLPPPRRHRELRHRPRGGPPPGRDRDRLPARRRRGPLAGVRHHAQPRPPAAPHADRGRPGGRARRGLRARAAVSPRPGLRAAPPVVDPRWSGLKPFSTPHSTACVRLLDVDLAVDGADVRLHRVRAQVGQRGDVGVALALGDQRQDLRLAVGEPRAAARASRSPLAGRARGGGSLTTTSPAWIASSAATSSGAGRVLER